MAVQNLTKDRYISFCNIECDRNADKLIAMLDKHLESGTGSEQWRTYFSNKRSEQIQMGRDNLNLIGNQINPLYEYFDECDDEEAQQLLYQLEQECC